MTSSFLHFTQLSVSVAIVLFMLSIGFYSERVFLVLFYEMPVLCGVYLLVLFLALVLMQSYK